MRGFSKSRSVLPALRFHNTLSNELETFKPLSVGKVKMYNCGPTVYGTQHIGNLSAAVLADTLRRVFTTWGYQVQQVINLTDFGHLSSDADEGEDKMTIGLRREGMALTLENMRVLAEKYIAEYFLDIDKLGVVREQILFPRASGYIEEQVALISSLEQKGYAYRTSQGVYYDVSRFPAYGKLGNIKLSGLKEGVRVEGNVEKRGPMDFILWKSDTSLGWESPWGRGFPGWHIECTAMIFTLLGKQIDVHTGGIEHIPVHHNNEIAQAEAVTGKQFVQYWLHNEHVTIEGKKIAKSLGNTVYLDDIIKRGISPRALRYWFLTGHYRTPVNFTWDALEGAHTALIRLTRFFHELPEAPNTQPDSRFMNEFYTACADDLDTPKAIALIWKLVKDDSVSQEVRRVSLSTADTLLGLGFSENTDTSKLSPNQIPEALQELIEKREEARKSKDFAAADTLRQEIERRGYRVIDKADGSRVERL